MPVFIYEPYGKEHGWQARVDRYIPEPESPERQLSWLRTEWKKDTIVKQELLSLAREYKANPRSLARALGKVNRRTARWAVVKRCNPEIILQATAGIVKQGLV